MKVLTPERWLRVTEAAIAADDAIVVTNPVGTGQIMVINAVTLASAIETQPSADSHHSGTMVLQLTTDPELADILAIGEADAQTASHVQNLYVAHLDFSWLFALATSGAAVLPLASASYSWRGLPFTHRPMTNVDLEVNTDLVGTDLTSDVVVDIWYQIVELEEGDLKFLPIGARIVRGAQIPPEGVLGPAGRLA